MSDQTEVEYVDGDVVWVKLGPCWWPGEVIGPDKLPPDVMPSFRKAPIAVVKFFQEDTYEYVKNTNFINKYNCSKKNEFIMKGLYMYRTKHGTMDKFPEDVIRAETATNGDIEILTRDEFQETKKESYAGLFGDPKSSAKKGRGKVKPSSASTPIRKVVKEKSDYQVHILVQESKQIERKDSTASHAESESEDKAKGEKISSPINDISLTPKTSVPPSTPSVSSSGIYACPSCPFSTTRLNILILHNKTHASTYTPYTPSPVRKKTVLKSPKSTPTSSKTPKPRKPREPKTTEKAGKVSKKKSQALKRLSDGDQVSSDVKKAKTDEEIKSSLLADWDDGDEESNDESSPQDNVGSPKVPVAAESPAEPIPAEQPGVPVSAAKKVESTSSSEKTEPSSDSKYDFCEDEDWPEENDVGRKIPRVKDPRKDETKNTSLDENEVAKEVAELLSKTTVPTLPVAPEPLKEEENFPETSIVKSPDKIAERAVEKPPEKIVTEATPTKAIFKTKTFFRSRHSRSQDVIGKYVADQLAAERIDFIESELNGSDNLSSPEARESPPVEQVKVARLAPKIQLKKMKAEAQLKEKEKESLDRIHLDDNLIAEYIITPTPKQIVSESSIVSKEMELDFTSNDDKMVSNLPQPKTEVFYPTEEIMPINSESQVRPIKQDSFRKISAKLEEKDNVTADTTTHLNIKPLCDIPVNIENDLNKNIENKIASTKMQDTEIIKISEGRDLEMEIDPAETHQSEPKIEVNYEVNKESSVVTSLRSDDVEISNPEESKNDLTETSETNLIQETEKLYDTPKEVSSEINKDFEPFIGETTASAVDALLSVSRDSDRVTKIISDDPPEDLFEDDNKDNGCNNNSLCINGLPKHQPIKSDISRNIQKMQLDIQNVEPNENLITEIELDTASQNKSQLSELPSNNESIDFEYKCEADKSDANLLCNEVTEKIPSESDLQIAEALINLPGTTLQTPQSDPKEDEIAKTSSPETTTNIKSVFVDEPMCIEDNVIEENIIENDSENPTMDTFKNEQVVVSTTENISVRFETEQEKNDNLNAAQSLVQMSECVEHKMQNVNESTDDGNKSIEAKKITESLSIDFGIDDKGPPDTHTVEEKIAALSSDNNSEMLTSSAVKYESLSKLQQILEEPTKTMPVAKSPLKQEASSGKERILNFDVAKTSPVKQPSGKQKIIIRRTGNKSSADKIILSRSKPPTDGSSVQTFTIQSSGDKSKTEKNTILIQPALRKVTKTPTKLTKIMPQNIIPTIKTTKTDTMLMPDEAMFDINSMPVVLSEDILTPENIEKMPVVMTDTNITISSEKSTKIVKTNNKPTIIDNQKISITSAPSRIDNKKTLIINQADYNKVTTPNILSKSAKLKGAKPMLVIDKATGKQKIIMTKAEPVVSEIKQKPTVVQPVGTVKGEKFLLLPKTAAPTSPRPGRTQKIVIDPQSGKALVLEPTSVENKPVSAKLMPASTDANLAGGNTVMIITNATGAQSRIVLTPEHEKILFPNKQQTNTTQMKKITHRITTGPSVAQKTTFISQKPAIVTQKATVTASPAKSPRIMPKQQQQSAIITSKGQLIVSGRVATTVQSIAPLPELRPAPPPVIRPAPPPVIRPAPPPVIRPTPAGRPAAQLTLRPAPPPASRLAQPAAREPLILLQQKSGAVLQLTALQFEQLQRSGQIIQKVEKRVRRTAPTGTTPTKRVKKNPPLPTLVKSTSPVSAPTQTIVITPASATATVSNPVPAIVSNPTIVPAIVSNQTIVPAIVSNPTIVPAIVSNPTIAPAPTVVSAPAAVITSAVSSTYELDNLEELLPVSAIVREPLVSPPAEPAPPPAPALSPAPASPPAPAPEPAPAALADAQLLAVPGEHFGGPVGTFYLCVEDSGNLTPVDNRPLVLENNQLVPISPPAPERRDILEAALANSDVFRAETEAPDFRDLNANVSVHCRVSETSTTLNQPIMTPVEVPSKAECSTARAASLEAGLAVIGVTPAVPTTLELPITVTDPRLAAKPPASMPLLTDDERALH